MQKTKIEWADYVWNPIKGVCPVDCKTPDGKSYCYARRIYQRFKLDSELSFNLDGPNAFREIEKLQRMNPKPGSRIFTCSTMELFHPLIPKEWRDDIFSIIKPNQQLTFIILTKMPENIDRPMPDNIWLGVSITGEDDVYDRYQGLLDAKAKVKFVSFEPLFKAVYLPIQINWAVIGRLTGHGHKYDPPYSLLKIMINTFQRNKIPVFMKNNLKDIWQRPLIQEWPK